jgi:hypothetical protein
MCVRACLLVRSVPVAQGLKSCSMRVASSLLAHILHVCVLRIISSLSHTCVNDLHTIMSHSQVKSGGSALEPSLLAGYGDGCTLPLLLTGDSDGVNLCCHGFSHVAFDGIELYAHTRDPAYVGVDKLGVTKCKHCHLSISSCTLSCSFERHRSFCNAHLENLLILIHICSICNRQQRSLLHRPFVVTRSSDSELRDSILQSQCVLHRRWSIPRCRHQKQCHHGRVRGSIPPLCSCCFRCLFVCLFV